MEAHDGVEENRGADLVLLKKNQPHKYFNARVGNLLLEVWGYPSETAASHACLIFESSNRETTKEGGRGSEKPDARLQATLDPFRACFLADVLNDWMLFLTSDLKEQPSPSLSVEIGSLILRLFSQQRGKASPRAEFIFSETGSCHRAVMLKPLEGKVLADALAGFFADDEKAVE